MEAILNGAKLTGRAAEVFVKIGIAKEVKPKDEPTNADQVEEVDPTEADQVPTVAEPMPTESDVLPEKQKRGRKPKNTTV